MHILHPFVCFFMKNSLQQPKSGFLCFSRSYKTENLFFAMEMNLMPAYLIFFGGLNQGSTQSHSLELVWSFHARCCNLSTSVFFSNAPTVVSFSATYTQNQCHILYGVLVEPVYILPSIVFYLRYCLEWCMYITHLKQKNGSCRNQYESYTICSHHWCGEFSCHVASRMPPILSHGDMYHKKLE